MMSAGSSQPRWGTALDAGAELDARAADAAAVVDRADEPADRGRWLNRWTWPALLAAAVTFGMAAGGVELWRAIAAAIGVAVALWAVIASMAAPRISWHADVPGRRHRTASSWDVPAMEGARESDATFDRYLRPRLWATAEQLLRARGIDPAGPQARTLVGSRLYDILTGANTDPGAVTRSVSALARAIALLAVDRSLPGVAPVRASALSGLAGPQASRTASAKGFDE